MATGPLSIKLRCASWQQLATIYKRDLSRGSMFLKAGTPPPIGTQVQIDLTLPSASVIVLTGTVDQHVTDPQRGEGVELKLAPIPASSVWMIESALASESKRRNTPAAGVPVVGTQAPTGPVLAVGDNQDVIAAEQELIKALLSEAESLRKLNPFLVLGVGYEATDTDVRAAFGELTKRYHPDLFARYESTELRQVAAEIFILIRDAYRKLGDDAGRAQALAALGRPAAPRAIANRAPTPPPVPVKRPRIKTSEVTVIGPPPLPPRRPQVPQAIIDGTPTLRPGETPPMPTAAVPPRVVTRAEPSSPEPGAPLRAESSPGKGAPPLPLPAPTQRPLEAPTARPGQTDAAPAPALTPLSPPPPRAQTPLEAPTARPGESSTTTPEPPAPTRANPIPSAVSGAASTPARGQPLPTVPMPSSQTPSKGIARIASEPPPRNTPSHGVQRLAPTRPPTQPPPPKVHEDPIDEMLDNGNFDEAILAYKIAAKKNPSDRGARAGVEVAEGLRAIAQRDRLEAAQRFEAALEIDPSNERAARELADMRRQATNERKGLLTRLMGKKE